ncbi:Uncharacterized protein Adt_06217 [Abeliophyllum distichum]|uniref:Uncharacterized protein n=1 Tax=Abeliophyllum distichum TaxID=126358 RepID=A0ABD1V6Q1_9LAMI
MTRSSDLVDHLRAFVDLMRATLDIKDLQMSAVVIAMISGSRSRPFKISLSKNLPDTMHKLLKKGDKYVDAEKAYFNTKDMKVQKEPESNKWKTRDDPEPQDDKGKQKMNYLRWNK